MTPAEVYALHPEEYDTLWKYRDQRVREHNRAQRRRR